MKAYGLHLNDLSLHGLQRDTIFLGEYISHEVERAHELDKLSRQLEREQRLSQTLLYNMLPPTVADDLRSGKTVEPKSHDHMTLFFSDIVGELKWQDQLAENAGTRTIVPCQCSHCLLFD